jgi:diguanylate cyclase (GGDEF)-like protein
MPHLTSIENDLKEIFTNYLEMYFVHRDKAATLAMLSPNLTGFGTGMDEKAYIPGDFLALYERDFAQAPDPINYQLKRCICQPFDENTAVVFGELDLNTILMDQSLHLSGLRLSIIYHKIEQTWLIEHLHISFPTQAHEIGESYPIKEMEDRAVVLEKLVQERTRELEITQKKLEEIAETDSMTRIYNRMKLDQVLQAEIQRANRYNSTFSVILFDIDNFKSINDTYGHQKGDQVLSELAGVVHKRVRNTDIVGRWGGDEFMTISPETTQDDAILLAETIRITIAAYDFGVQDSVTSSFGVTAWHGQDSYNALMDRVDKSLYKAKLGGKNQVAT